MRATNILSSAALALLPMAGAALAQEAVAAEELPSCEGCADSMVIMS